MRRSHLFLVASFVAVFVAACGGSAATPAPGGGGQTAAPAAPGGSPAPVATPAPAASQVPAASSGTQGQVPAGLSCAGQPTFSLENPDQSLAPDTALISRFPDQIDGQPLTDVSAQSWLQWICYWGGDQALASAFADLPAGLNVANLSLGSATATVDGESVDVSAFRVAGGDASQLVQSIAQLAAQTDSQGTLSQVNVGGKSVYQWTAQDGSTTDFIYPSGDTLFVLSDVTESQAGKVFAALQ